MLRGRNRVVVTGMAGLCPLGRDWATVRQGLRDGRSGILHFPEWRDIDRLECRLGGPVPGFSRPERWPRRKTRSLGRVAELAVAASEEALVQAGLLGTDILGTDNLGTDKLDSDLLSGGRVGVAFGSGWGDQDAVNRLTHAIHEQHTIRGIAATDYLKLMPHTCSANISQFFELTGRQIATSTACTSGSQAIGLAYETIESGRQDIMIAGGAEELSVHHVVIFDVMRATATRNEEPAAACRPFDTDRGGVVVGEGAAALVLEARDHAIARGAEILAEVIGFGTNSDGAHMTRPNAASMQGAIELALADAGLSPQDVGYVNAHATATDLGDVAESHATLAAFGPDVPVSSLKGHMGHCLGASGAIEAWCTLRMWNEGWVAPTLNLDRVDQRCAKLDYVRSSPRPIDTEFVMSNNFAFGGLNTSLVFRRADKG